MATTIEIEDFYPYSFQPKVRYGGEKPSHQLIETLLAKRLFSYEERLHEFTRFIDNFLTISKDFDPNRPVAPYWLNGWFPTLDAITLYGLVASGRPKRLYEIGSGNSTKFAALAKRTYSPDTLILSIDPAPRAEIDQLCDIVLRQPLEECDPSLFHDLQPGDILFLDGSHRLLQNSDVCVFFLEVLPIIKPGVYLHLHDICLPYDYPQVWTKRMYSEQYVLASILLYGNETFEVVLPNSYISWCTDLPMLFQKLWNVPHLQGIERHGSSFWFTKAASQTQNDADSTNLRLAE